MMLPWLQYLSTTRMNTNVAFDAMELWMKGFNHSLEMVAGRSIKEPWIGNAYSPRRRRSSRHLPGCCTAKLFLKQGILVSGNRSANRYICDDTGSC